MMLYCFPNSIRFCNKKTTFGISLCAIAQCFVKNQFTNFTAITFLYNVLKCSSIAFECTAGSLNRKSMFHQQSYYVPYMLSLFGLDFLDSYVDFF